MINNLTIENDIGDLFYLDFVSDNDLKNPPFPDEPHILGLQVFKKTIQLQKNLSEINEEKEFLEEINKYVKFHDRLKFSDNSRRNLSVLITAGSTVACEGRRGPAQNLLISEDKFEELLAEEERDSIYRIYKVYFSQDENLDYVLVWRNGKIDEPGCILVKNEEKYKFVSTGFHPELQFVKIDAKKEYIN